MVLKMVKKSDELTPKQSVVALIITSIIVIWAVYKDTIFGVWNQYWLVIIGLLISIIIGIMVILKNRLKENSLSNEEKKKEQELHRGIIKKNILKEKGAQLEGLNNEEKEFLLNKWVDEKYLNEISGKSSKKQFITEFEKVKPLSHHQTQKIITQVGTKCCYPNCKEDITLEVHHIIPRSEGGSNKENNLVVLCNNHHKLADVGSIPKQRLRHHSVAMIKRK